MPFAKPTSVLVHNERVKATAALLNTISAALIAFGLLKPFFDGGLATVSEIAAAVVALIVAGFVHILTRWSLRRLRMEEEI